MNQEEKTYILNGWVRREGVWERFAITLTESEAELLIKQDPLASHAFIAERLAVDAAIAAQDQK